MGSDDEESTVRSRSDGERGGGRRFLAVVGWIAVLAASAHLFSSARGLRLIRRVAWPTDVYAFQQMDFGPIDVAVVGASRASFGVPPTALDLALAPRIGRSTQSVNLSRDFASIFAETALAEDLLRDRTMPAVVVVEVAPETVNSFHHRNETNMAEHVDFGSMTRCFRAAETLDGWVGCTRPLFRGIERIAPFFAGRVDYRTDVEWLLVFHGGGQYCYGTPECDEYNEAYERDPAHRWDVRLERVKPKIRPQRYTRFQLGEGIAHESLLDLCAWGRDNGVEVVLLNMPIHRAYQSEIPPDIYGEYLDYMQGLAIEEGVVFHDANTEDWWDRRDLFLDLDHLNHRGARLLAEEVAHVVAPLLGHSAESAESAESAGAG